MSFNQQLREPRVLAILTPRLIALMAFVAAALLVAGCQIRAPPRCSRSDPPPAASRHPTAAIDGRRPDGHRSRRRRA